MASPVTTPPVTAATTGPQEEDDVQLRRAVTLESYSGHVYTHCGHPKHEFYCGAYRKSCVLAARDPVHVCNRGFKWFSSIKSCLASCVNGRHVSDRSYGGTLFFPCTRSQAVTLESYSGHVYTHCGHPKHEFYCSAFRKVCVLAATNPAHVCNRGFNWFSSIKSCLTSCVNGRHVSDRCYRSILFFPCTRQDVLHVPWYFHGKKCVAWSFPQGTCLSVGRRGVYRSWEECRRRCVLRTESECDETPAAETGSPRQLRHPYFADMQAHSGARCVNVTRCALKSHRILIGSNQFDSLDACRRACVRS
ncbi:uncharacterized protein LOC142775386 [Rhipicephalus microplus]|uniref:uncharacterized protein LOC142775386 n=1 Tax=Rhipicephalus microplus TaxID=6941 RepID=UPI003F6C4981